MMDLPSVSLRPHLFSLAAGSILDRASTSPALSGVQARADSFVTLALSQADDWRTAALMAAPLALAGLHRFALRGRSVLAVEAFLAKGTRVEGFAASYARMGLPLLAGASLAIGCGCPNAGPLPKSPEEPAP